MRKQKAGRDKISKIEKSINIHFFAHVRILISFNGNMTFKIFVKN